MPNNTKFTSSSADEGASVCVPELARSGNRRSFAAVPPSWPRVSRMPDPTSLPPGWRRQERYFGGRVPIRRPYHPPDTATVEWRRLDSASVHQLEHKF